MYQSECVSIIAAITLLGLSQLCSKFAQKFAQNDGSSWLQWKLSKDCYNGNLLATLC